MINQPKRRGRPGGEISFTHVSYSGAEYTVGHITFKGDPVDFVIDREDYEKVVAYPTWHVTARNYISTDIKTQTSKRPLYLHNLVMGRLTFEGKGQEFTIDHINRNGFDNRKANLRLVSQTDQNINQRQKPRSCILPETCGVTADEIPRHIWYAKAHGAHGDRFVIEFKSEHIEWKTTSSKLKSTREKLQEAKEKLVELYELYPHLNPNEEMKVAQVHNLNSSFDAIVSLAHQT